MTTFADLAVGDAFTVIATGVPYVKRIMATMEHPGVAERVPRDGDPPPPSDVYGLARPLQMLRADTPVERCE